MLIFQKNRNKKPRIAHKGDRQLYFLVALFILVGLIILSSASSVMAYTRYGDEYYLFKHQLIGLSMGIIAFLALSRINYYVLKKYALLYLIFSIILLILVFIPGLAAKHGTAKSWITIFGFSLQPSEFVKLTFLLYLSAWLEARKKDLHDLHLGIGPFLVSLGVITLLMLKQPDIGTLLIIGFTALVVYFVGGGSKKHITFIIVFALLFLSIMVQLRSYQMDRFRCVLDPEYSINNKCYQTHQSLIAVGSGGFLGRGLGESRQKFMYLPEVFGDFIFAVVGEELGWLISVFIILCFLFLFYKGYKIAKMTEDDFGRNLAIGIVTWIVFQAIINIGGTISLLPMTGVPLPLISYGGSSLLATLAGLGVLVNISKYTR